MKKLLDLRFVIGVFFLIVGILLFIYHFTGTKDASMSMSVNLWCGIVFIAFGTGMIVLSNTNKITDKSQE
jgi:prolipoprotein diacylglyceryltransferase